MSVNLISNHMNGNFLALDTTRNSNAIEKKSELKSSVTEEIHELENKYTLSQNHTNIIEEVAVSAMDSMLRTNQYFHEWTQEHLQIIEDLARDIEEYQDLEDIFKKGFSFGEDGKFYLEFERHGEKYKTVVTLKDIQKVKEGKGDREVRFRLGLGFFLKEERQELLRDHIESFRAFTRAFTLIMESNRTFYKEHSTHFAKMTEELSSDSEMRKNILSFDLEKLGIYNIINFKANDMQGLLRLIEESQQKLSANKKNIEKAQNYFYAKHKTTIDKMQKIADSYNGKGKYVDASI